MLIVFVVNADKSVLNDDTTFWCVMFMLFMVYYFSFYSDQVYELFKS